MTEEERYSALEQEKQNALNNSNKTYEDLLNQNQQYSNSYNDYLNQYKQIQNDEFDKQTQFQVDLQNRNKEEAEKEYQKESIASKNAYYDFINPYGLQAEIQAQNGLNRTGYSETAKSQAWTTQQNRTAQAKANLNKAKLQFDDAIAQAYRDNDANKAQLALQILQQQQEETLRNFNYISDTKQNQLSTSLNLDSEYNNRYNTLYSQIQQEKAREEAIRQWEAEMAEKQRQYNESLAYQKEQDRIAQTNWQKEYELSKKQADAYSIALNEGTKTEILENTPEVVNEVEDEMKNQKIISNEPIKVRQSPFLSSSEANEWYNQNIGIPTAKTGITPKALTDILSSGLSLKKITEKDVKTILKLYGLE